MELKYVHRVANPRIRSILRVLSLNSTPDDRPSCVLGAARKTVADTAKIVLERGRHPVLEVTVYETVLIIRIPELLLVEIFSLFALSNYGISCQKQWYQPAVSVHFISRPNSMHVSFFNVLF